MSIKEMNFDNKEKIQQLINFIKAIDYKCELGVFFKDKEVDQSFWLNLGNKKEPINRVLSQNQLRNLIMFLEFSIEDPNIAFDIQFSERTSKQFLQFIKQEQLVQQSIQNKQPNNQQHGRSQQLSQKVEKNEKQSILQVDSIIPQKICEQTHDQILNQSSILDYQEQQSFTIENQMLQQFGQTEIILNIDKCPKYSKESIFIKTLTKFDPQLKVYFCEPRLQNSYKDYFKYVVGCNIEEWRRHTKKHVYLVTKQRQIEEFPSDLEYYVDIYDAWNKFCQKKKYVLIDCLVNSNAEILELDDFGVCKIKFCQCLFLYLKLIKNDAEITLKFDDDDDHRAYTEFIRFQTFMLKYNPHFKYNNSYLIDRSLGSMIDNSSIVIDAEEIISQIQPDKIFEIGTKKGIVLFQYFIQKFARDNIKYCVQLKKDNRFSKFFNSYLQIVEIFPNFFNNLAASSILLDDISKINIKQQLREDIVKEDDPQQKQKIQENDQQDNLQTQNTIQNINFQQELNNNPNKQDLDNSCRSEKTITLFSAVNDINQSRQDQAQQDQSQDGGSDIMGSDFIPKQDLAASFKASIVPSEINQQNNSDVQIQLEQSIFGGAESSQLKEQPQELNQIKKKENQIKITQIEYVLTIDKCPLLDTQPYQLYLDKFKAALPNTRLIFKKPQIKPEYKQNFLNKAECLTEDEMFFKIKQKFYLVTLNRQFTEFSDDLVYFKYEEKAIQDFAQNPKFVLIQFRGLKDTKIKWVGKQHEMFKLKESNLAYPEIIIEHQKTGL